MRPDDVLPVDDIAPGRWLVGELTSLGRVRDLVPASYAAHVRVPEGEEWLSPPEEPRAASLWLLRDVLARHTSTPDDCWLTFWEGFLPSTVEEKPHWGERHSCSSGTYFAASSMRRLRSSLLSSTGLLVVTSPSTTCLPSGTNRSGSKPPERSSSNSRKKPSTSSSLNSASATKS